MSKLTDKELDDELASLGIPPENMEKIFADLYAVAKKSNTPQAIGYAKWYEEQKCEK